MLLSVSGRLDSLTRIGADKSTAVFDLSHAERNGLLISLLKTISDSEIQEVRNALSLVEPGLLTLLFKVAQVEVASESTEIRRLQATARQLRDDLVWVVRKLEKRLSRANLPTCDDDVQTIRGWVIHKVEEVLEERKLAARALNLLAKATEI